MAGDFAGGMSALRGWVVAHHGVAVAVSMVGLSLLLGLGASTLIPVPGQVTRLPIWQLTPPAFAILASLATVNRLPASAAGSQIIVARASWCAAVVALGAGCAALIDLRSGLPPLWPATAVLVLVTFGVAAIVGRLAVWVGAAMITWIVTHANTYASTANPWSLPEKGARIGVIVVCVISVLGYVVRGGRGPGERGA